MSKERLDELYGEFNNFVKESVLKTIVPDYEKKFAESAAEVYELTSSSPELSEYWDSLLPQGVAISQSDEVQDSTPAKPLPQNQEAEKKNITVNHNHTIKLEVFGLKKPESEKPADKIVPIQDLLTKK